MNPAPASFHPLIARWFAEKLGEPTDVQRKAWAEVSRGGHILATAPTGSGKTLAAFLWAINQLATAVWPTGSTRVLYISPLKALNNDIQRNLLGPLEEIKAAFEAAGKPLPSIRVMTRSGDTDSSERRLMLRRPPEILITTPESLNIMLSSKNSRAVLAGITTVILDEIHAVVNSKRGTHLITAVERLTLLCGEFQRIALSATVRPLEMVADFIGGYRQSGTGPESHYEKRKVGIIRSEIKKTYDIKVAFPENAREIMTDDSWWPVLAQDFKDIIRRNRSTLLFTNSRRTCEKVARLINEGEEELLAYSHHGSISRELRLEVERRMKAGQLKAIVATNSLELGIDIGDLDEVILVQTPRSIASSVQRIGRAGHQVGEPSRGRLYPTHGMDFLDAAVTAKSVMEQAIEPMNSIDAPLDILAQMILSMTAADIWDIDQLYSFLKTAYPYRNLPRKHYDLLLEMLAGRYADSRLRELAPRISLDKIDNTIRAKDNVPFLLYSSGGTIADRGYFDLRMEGTKAKIGELDEEFVWERQLGDTFALGTQVWRIQRITHNDVEVVPAEGRPGIIPFWRAEDQGRDFFYSERLLTFLEAADLDLEEPEAFEKTLIRDYFMGQSAAAELVGFLVRQRESSGGSLPHRHRLMIEHYDDPSNQQDRKQVILHTLWGGRVNRPLALALSAAWEKEYHYPLEVFANNDQILLMLPHEFQPKSIFTMVTPENLYSLLQSKLESTGFFGAHFRENAGRALLLPRGNFHKRLPLWLNRLRSKKLLEAVSAYEDFPIMLETWRECLSDEFDLENLKLLLDELSSGTIEIKSFVTQTPSPFCEGIIWYQTNKYMYEDDTPAGKGRTASLSRQVMEELLFSKGQRPRISKALISELEQKLQRTAPGYAPTSSIDLLDFLKDRQFMTIDDWNALLASASRDSEIPKESLIKEIENKITVLPKPEKMVLALENKENAEAFFLNRPNLSIDDRGQEILAGWFSYYGPVPLEKIQRLFSLPGNRLQEMLDSLAEDRRIIIGELTEDSAGLEVCDTENLERLLRMARKARQSSFKALNLESLPLFLAAYQGLLSPGNTIEAMQDRLEALFGYPAAAEAWEEFILPSRIQPYYPEWLDSLLQSSPLIWFGCGSKEISFSFAGDLELFATAEAERKNEAEALFPHASGRFSLFDISRHLGLDTEKTSRRLWDFTWQGLIANDSYETLRKGIANKFKPSHIDAASTGGRRSFQNRWASSRPIAGSWYLLDLPSDHDSGEIENQELLKDRVRILLDRYGILFRELLTNELPLLQWGAIFKTLRLMELSGEILSGHFFDGIQGLQFISSEALRFLQEGLPNEKIYSLNAADPASLCGIRLEGLKGSLPRRLPSNDLVFRGTKLALVSQRGGSVLEFFIPPDDPHFGEYLSFFKTKLSREFNPESSISVETINSIPSHQSEYKKALLDFGFISNYKALELWKRY